MSKYYQIIENKYFPVITSLIGYLTIFLFQKVGLNYDYLRSDVLGYWQDSINWRTPFNSFHVPGYPLIISLFRGLTFNILPPITYMVAINCIAFVICILMVYSIIKKLMNDPIYASFGALLFAFWPFVGLTYTVSPLADIPCMMFFLAGLNFLIRKQKIPAAVLLGLSLIVHKAIWPFVAFVVLILLIQSRPIITRKKVIFVIVLLIPIVALWIAGAFYHHSITWLISSNMNVEIKSKSVTPIFDGLIGTLLGGGIKDIIKGILLLFFFVVGTFALFLSVKNNNQVYSSIISTGICIAILSLFVILNRGEIWAAVRFSRLLVFPLTFFCLPLLQKKLPQVMSLRFSTVFFLAMFISQIIFAWYEARIFFA